MVVRYIRFKYAETDVCQYGELDGKLVHALAHAPWFGIEQSGQTYDLENVTLVAPVEPSKIVCIGLNYHAHVEASYSAENAPERPLIFLKPPSAIIGPEEKIIHPKVSRRVDYEAELGLVIGKTATKTAEAEAESHIFGFTCVNDVTARDLQKPDGQWSRAKGFDTFCPVGPHIVTDLNYQDLLVEGILNDTVMQSGRTSLMIFNIPFLISYVSSIMTLNPGDLLVTGTPAGIAPMKPGDKIEIRVEGIGTLRNYVA